MTKFTGKGVYGAVAIGRIAVFKRGDIQVRRVKTDDTAAELQRFEAARDAAIAQLSEIYEKALTEVGVANAQIFDIHIMMAQDEDYNDSITEMISTQSVNAEYAVAMTSDNFAEMFAAMDDSYMQARSADVRDVSNRIIRCLTNSDAAIADGGDDMIICADDLAPSETVDLDKSRVLAFATAGGSQNSHTAILARSMNIPAIIGLGEEFLQHLHDGATAIADGYTGELILDPDEDTLARYRAKQQEDADKKALLQKLKGKENITLDGRSISIFANIGSADNIGDVLLNDAGGIGLFRSEFIYLGRSELPSEEEQCRIYKRVLESMAGKKVVIRTLDIGADKQVDYLGMKKEENPALGMRAIRLCLSRPEIFKVQLRALYRASAYGRLSIMFPMIASEWEVKEILRLCEETKAELSAEGAAYSDNVELGIMIETPAAALISDKLAELVDFFSVGTNDLTQYTLACDRQNPTLERYCDPHHEAVLKLIELSCESAHRHGAWIGICGELAADTTLTERFIRMGIDELSVSPSYVLKVRDAVRKLDLSEK